MNALRNSVRLIGHLGDKPKVLQFESGRKIVNFSVATNEIYNDSEGKRQTQTTWHRVVANGKVAEIALKYFDKGTRCAVEGKLVNRSYADKSGNTQFITEVVTRSLMLLGDKRESSASIPE